MEEEVNVNTIAPAGVPRRTSGAFFPVLALRRFVAPVRGTVLQGHREEPCEGLHGDHISDKGLSTLRDGGRGPPRLVDRREKDGGG